MSRRIHLRVSAALDMSRPQEGTVTIDRASGVFSVRPLHRRRAYELPLAVVASMVVQKIVKAEVAEARAAKRQRRRKAA